MSENDNQNKNDSTIVNDVTNSVGKSLESLVSVVLDAAEVANRSATVAASSTGSLINGVDKLNGAAGKNSRNSIITLFVCALLLIISASFFIYMSTKLSKRVNQVDAMLLAVGKRVLEMDSGVEALEKMESSLVNFNQDQLELKAAVEKTQEKMDIRLKEAIDISTNTNKDIPKQTENSISKSTQIIEERLAEINNKINKRINDQRSYISNIDKRIDTVNSSVEKINKSLIQVNNIKSEVEALVVLEKKKYLEAIRELNEKNKKIISLEKQKQKKAKLKQDSQKKESDMIIYKAEEE